MSSVYNPNGTLPAPSVAAQQLFPITSSTNTTPIVVQIAAGPGFADQDTVEILNHQTNTNANGVWVVTMVDSTHYSLNGSVGNGVGGATGTAQDFSVTPLLTLPGDGDLASASSVNPALEGNGNIGPFLYRLAGAYRLINIYQSSTFGDVVDSSPVWSNTTSLSSATFVNATSATGLMAGQFPGSVGSITSDLFRVTCVLTAAISSNNTGDGFLTLGFNHNGGSYSPADSGATAIWLPGGSSTNPPQNLTMDILISPPASNIFDFSIMVRKLNGAGPISVQLIGGGSLKIAHYRQN